MTRQGEASEASARLWLGSAEDRGDAGTFLHRVTRLDPAAHVRLRALGDGVELWAWLPLDVLVSRRVEAHCDAPDVTVRAGDLLRRLADRSREPVTLPAPEQVAWSGALPPRTGWRRIDRVPGAEVERLVHAGERAFRAAAPSAANANRVGAALLDHEALVVSDASEAVPVPLRVPQALARMGFLARTADRPGAAVAVSVAAGWARFDAAYGVAYLRRTPALSLMPI